MPVVPVPWALAGLLSVESVRAASNIKNWERGLELLKTRIPMVSATPATLEASIAGSNGELYTQTFTVVPLKSRSEGRLQIRCTCPAYTGSTTCKHGIAAALATLGYEYLAPEPVPEPLRAADLVDGLDDATVRTLLRQAAERHDSVSATVLSAVARHASEHPSRSGRSSPTDGTPVAYWDEAAALAVRAVYGSTESRDWRNVGERLADALQAVLDDALATGAADGVAAVVHQAILVADDDRYGDLETVVESAVQALADLDAAEPLDDELRARLAETLGSVTANPWVLDEWGLTDNLTVITLLGSPGRAALESLVATQAQTVADYERQGTDLARRYAQRAQHVLDVLVSLRDRLTA